MLIRGIEQFFKNPGIQQHIEQNGHKPDYHDVDPEGGDKDPCNHFSGCVKMGFYELMDGIQIDRISFLDQVPFIFRIVIKSLVVCYEFFQGVVGVPALKFLELLKLKGLSDLIDFVRCPFECLCVEILQGLQILPGVVKNLLVEGFRVQLIQVFHSVGRGLPVVAVHD